MVWLSECRTFALDVVCSSEMMLLFTTLYSIIILVINVITKRRYLMSRHISNTLKNSFCCCTKIQKKFMMAYGPI